jgi:hypothetical protein
MTSQEIRDYPHQVLSAQATGMSLLHSFFSILCELTAQVAEFNERERERAATIAAALRGEE